MLNLLTLISLISSSQASNTCRVLALGGGSDKGAYCAGAVIGLIKSLPQGEAQWDVVTGNGDGAINAYILAQASKGDEQTASSNLDDFWSKFTWSDFYQDWDGWLVTGLFFESGLYNAKNMYQTIDSLGKNSFARFIGVGATDLITGGYVFFNSSLSMGTMQTGVKASATNAGIFPIIDFQNFKLVHGSIKFSVDILHGIDACHEKGFQDENIVIDVVLDAGKKMKKIDASGYKTLQVLFRYLQIASFDLTNQVVEDAKHDHPKVNIRHVVFPTEALPDSLYPYDYSQSQLLEMINLGIKDAADSVETFYAETK